MPGSPEWQNSATQPVLRLLSEHDLALSASAIYYNLSRQLERPPSRSTVTRALKGLRDAGLVDQPYRSLYEITDKGEAYFASDLDDSEL